MNSPAISEFVTIWLIVNIGAMLLLAVMSYFGSMFILDWLGSLDRRLYAAEHNHPINEGPDNPPHPPEPPKT